MASQWLARRRIICAIAVFLVVVVAIGLGVGLGIGLAKERSAGSLAQTGPATCTKSDQNALNLELSSTPPANASRRIGEAFISFAFEFASFSVFAGNKTSPGTYSNNLLNNIGDIMGTKPYVRVGGTSSDFAILDSDLGRSVTGRLPFTQPVGTEMLYSDTFFESFDTWPDTKYIYGFDLAHIVGSDAAAGWTSLKDTVPLICKALNDGKLAAWELGNEPNMYHSPPHDVVGDQSWDEDKYITVWKNGTDVIRSQLSATPECSALADPEQLHFIGPSMWLPDGSMTNFTLQGLWAGGYDSENLLQSVSMHRYFTSTSDGGTIADTLLNHTKIQTGLADALMQYAELPDGAPPLVLGETNSFAPIGQRGVTDTLAGALWVMNWALWSASKNVTRVHFQQGDNFHYNAWQPVDNGLDPLNLTSSPTGTKPPYYGHLAAAYAVGDSGHTAVQVFALPLRSEVDVAYAIFADGVLARVAVLNLREYQDDGNGNRPTQRYKFYVPPHPYLEQVSVHRLVGPAADATSGVQWDGFQYELEPEEGLPTQTNNVTTNERYKICDGQVTIELDDSSAVVLQFMA